MGAERREGEGAPAGDSRGAGLPGLRKARVPRGRLGLGVGAGGGGAAQRDPGWKPRGAPRPSRGVCLLDCLGWRGDRTRAPRGGERIGSPSAEVGAGRSARAAGGGDSGGLTAVGEGPRRRLSAAHVRGPGQGLSPQAAGCVGRRGARVESPPLPASPSVEPGAGMPGRLVPSSNAVGSKRGRDRGGPGRAALRAPEVGPGIRDSY